MDLALQPDPALPIHICGEIFSRHGAWVEGAVGTADDVATRLLSDTQVAPQGATGHPPLSVP
jgi:monoamine oxidase